MIPFVMQTSAEEAGEALALGLTATCCLAIIVVIVVLILIFALFWRATSDKRVEVHTTTVEKSSKSDRYCPDCGRGIPFDAKTCPYCSKKFE